MRDEKAAPQASKAASPETEEKPKFKLAAAAKVPIPFEPARFNPDDLTQAPALLVG